VRGGDLNGDDLTDIVTVSSGEDFVTAFLNNGVDFDPGDPIQVRGGPRSVAFGDFDHDSLLDIAVISGTYFGLTVLIGDGEGGFTPSTMYGTGWSPRYVSVGDFDEDGREDIIVANYLDHDLTLLMNNFHVITIDLISENDTGVLGDSLILSVELASAVDTTTSSVWGVWVKYPGRAEILLYGPEVISLEGGEVVNETVTLWIPERAPLGDYIITGRVGSMERILFDKDSVPLRVISQPRKWSID
jgi:hypothetical protein